MDTRSPGGAPRLLYVEDDRVIAGMTVEVLAEAYDVTHVTDGRHAFQRALSERFDVNPVMRCMRVIASRPMPCSNSGTRAMSSTW